LTDSGLNAEKGRLKADIVGFQTTFPQPVSKKAEDRTDNLQPIYLMHSYLRELFFGYDETTWYRFKVDPLRDIRAALPWVKPTLRMKEIIRF
jgi:hypothetical protein